MSRKIRRAVSGFLSAVMLFVVAVTQAAALPVGLEYVENGKGLPDNDAAVSEVQSLSDGQVYTYTTAYDTDLSGNELPATDFRVGLSAIGQQYSVTTTSTLSYNIVFVLDVSGSMNDNSKAANMVETVNNAVAALGKSDNNKIGIVTFSYTANKSNSTDTPLVGLTKGSIQLSATYNSGWGGSYYTISVNGGSSVDVDGGTNIQAGMNAAYKMLNNADNKDTAIPVIILLSDGVPTYWYESYDRSPLYTGETGRSGNGYSSSSSNNLTAAAAYTIMQAAYLKHLMSSLRIYTVGFTTEGDQLATAALDPTDSHISAASGLKNYLSKYYKYGDYHYSDGSYTASNSVSSLGTALNNIITKIKQNKPIAEKTTTSGFSPVSYVRFEYAIGTGYDLLGDTMTVALNGTQYTFKKNGSAYIATSGGSEEMDKISLSVSDGKIIWQIPASVLPCHVSNPSKAADYASPITLYFMLRFNESSSSLSAGSFQTANSCVVTFYPTEDNPRYYSLSTVNGDVKYYQATFPYLGSDDTYSQSKLPSLFSFSAGDSLNSLTNVPTSSVTVNEFSTYPTSDKDSDMTVTYTENGISTPNITFDSLSRVIASANLVTTDKIHYTVSGFTDGIRSYSDAAVTGVSGSNYTVSYNGGKSSIVFTGVSLNDESTYETVTASFKLSGGQVSVSQFKIDGKDMKSQSSMYAQTKTGSSGWLFVTVYYTVTVLCNNKMYSFDIEFPWYSSTSNETSMNNLVSTKYTVSPSLAYYITQTSQTARWQDQLSDYRFTYTDSPESLKVEKMQNGSYVLEDNYSGEGTTIEGNSTSGYTITQISGSVKTITSYSIKDNTVYKSVTTITGRNGVSLQSGMVTQSLSSTGSIELKGSIRPESVVTSATLKSALNASAVAVADSSGKAYLVLTLTVDQAIKNLNVDLNGASGFAFAVDQVISCASTWSSLPSSLSAGTYKITYRVSGVSGVDQYTAYLSRIGFTLAGGSVPLEMTYTSTSADKNVTVVLSTPFGY